MARLNHPCLVNVFDQGVDHRPDGDHVFLVMELVPGGTLRELLRERGPMPPHAALAVMGPVLEALALAHEEGMVHRDVKPDNVLIRDDHQVKLADFGLVRASRRDVTSGGPVIGTAAYLSPEQVRGGHVGPEGDVYSAGILLFELLTGRTPFRGSSPEETALMRLDNEVPAPSTLIAGVPPNSTIWWSTPLARTRPHVSSTGAVSWPQSGTPAGISVFPISRSPRPPPAPSTARWRGPSSRTG